MDLQVLKAELLNDPLARGYSVLSDAEVADSLNTVDRARSRGTISGSEIMNATNSAEFALLSDINKDRWLAVCAVDNIDTENGVAKSLEAEIFGAGTITRTNLVAIKTETISRATELGLEDVRAGDVGYARTL